MSDDLVTRLRAIEEPLGIRCEPSQLELEAANEITSLRAENERLTETLLSRHGGEPLALLNELDEARAERDLAEQRLRAVVELAARGIAGLFSASSTEVAMLEVMRAAGFERCRKCDFHITWNADGTQTLERDSCNCIHGWRPKEARDE